jgi:protein-S-isoprenylcysteine O-methyltransferase Ste14
MAEKYIIVAIQFICTIFIAVTGRVVPGSLILKILLVALLLFGLWAVLEWRFRFNILPDVPKGHSLITSGPYRFARHPMYTAFIFITLIWVMDDYTLTRFIVWCVLVIDLSYKMNLEESILARELPEYIDYRRRTKRLIPFIY